MNRSLILSVGIASMLSFPAMAVDRNWVGGGVPGVWTDPANWDIGVPVNGDKIFMHLLDSLTAPAMNADSFRIGVGTPGVAGSGFTFGPGAFTVGYVAVAEAFEGLNPANNTFGRAFINAGTTLNVGSFYVGERSGGTGQVVQSGGDVTISNQLRVGHWPQTDVGAGTASIYTLNGGNLTVTGNPTDPFAEGQGGNVFLGIDSTGILRINGGVFTAKGVTLDNRGATAGEDTFEINGGLVNIGANGIVSSNAATPSTYKVVLAGGTLRATASWTSNLETMLGTGTGIQVDTNSNAVTFSGVLKGTGGLTKIGNGVLKLTGNSSYSGTTTVTAGTLQLGDGGTGGDVGASALSVGSGASVIYARTDTGTITGAVSGTGNLLVTSGTLRVANGASALQTSVAAGATLAMTGTMAQVTADTGSSLEAGVSGTGTFTAGNLIVNGATLKVTVGSSNTKFVVSNPGGLIANGANVIQLNLLNLTAGVYPLVDYTGTIGGLGAAGFTLEGLPSRAIGGLVHNTGGTSLDLNITSIDYPKWTGAANGDWDLTSLNWKLVTGGGTTAYQNLDAVLFDDTASNNTTINLVSDVTPTSVLLNHTDSHPYLFTGSGALVGSMGLTKQGAGRTVIANFGLNSYMGPTVVQGGVLQIGDGAGGSLSAASVVSISAGAAVELNLPFGAIYGSATSGAGTVRTIGASTFEVASGVLTGTLKAEIAGDSIQVVSVNNQPLHDGNITVKGGALRALGVQALGSVVGATAISNGGTLDVNNFDLGAEAIFVEGAGVNDNGAIVNNGGGTIFNLHKVTLTDNATFGGTGRWDIRSTGISGELLDLSGRKLTKVGGNQVSVVDVNITPGDIDINGGIFGVENFTQVQGTGTIRLNPGGRLGLWANKPGMVTRNIVAAGGGIAELGSGGASMLNSPILLEADLTFNVPNGTAGTTVLTQAGAITEGGDSHSVNVNGGGRLILTGNNNWTGGYSVNNAVLQIGTGGSDGTLGTGPGTITGTLVIAKDNATTINGDINSGGGAGTMILLGGGTTTLAFGTDVNLSQLHAGLNGTNDTVGGTLEVGSGTTLTIGDTLALGNSGGSGSITQGVLNQTGGTVTVNAPGTDGRQFVLGHWGSTQGVYNLSSGVLTSPNISMSISWDGEGIFNLSGGTATVKGLRFGHNAGRTGVFTMTSGELNLGSDGIWEQNAGYPNDINLGGGVVRATTDTSIFLPAELTGTNGYVSLDSNGFSLTVAGALFGEGGFKKIGAGRMVLNAPYLATGGIVIEGGTLSLQGSQAENRAPANGMVQVEAGSTLEFGSTNVAPFTTTYFARDGGTITNAALVEHVHLGSVQLSGAIWTTHAASGSYHGENYFLHGPVTVSGTAPSMITQEGGTAANRGIGWTGEVMFFVNDVTGNGAADVTVSTELEDSDAGAASLLKAGEGTMKVTFANTYTGGTTVAGGTLLVNNSTGSGTGTGNVTIQSRLSGSGTVGAGGAVTVAMNGRLAPGDGAGTLTFNLGTGVLDLTGAVNSVETGRLEFELGAVSDRVVLASGGLTIGSGALNLNDFAFTFGSGMAAGDYLLFDGTLPINGTLGTNLAGPIGLGYFGTLDYADGTNDLTLHVVPEPGSALLLLGGLGLLGIRRRRAV